MKLTGSFARLSVLLCVGVAGGCIITSSEDTVDDTGSASDAEASASDPDSASADDGPTTADDGPSTIDDTGADSDDGMDDGTTGPSGDCSENIVLDPSFESGTPSAEWTEASETFDTPICDASCTEDEGAGPYDGDWWVWFGGVDTPETASVSQEVTIATAENAVLSFRFAVNASAATGDDTVTVFVDETEVWMISDAEMEDYADYARVDVDVTAFADGAAHTVRFEANHPGTGLTNFFLDSVSLVTCNEGGDSSGSDSDSGSTAADTTAGSTDTGSTGDTGTSDSGGSSGSSTTL